MSTATNSSNSQRLDRVEDKLDRLTEAVVTLARVEEKLINVEEDVKNLIKGYLELQKSYVSHDQKINAHEKSIEQITGATKRLLWIMVTCVIMTLGGLWLTKKFEEAQQIPQQNVNQQAKPISHP